MMRRRTKREEVYRLHIDVPLSLDELLDIGPKHAHDVKHEEKSEGLPREKFSWGRFFLDKMEFLFVSLMVFAVAYIILNYEALAQNIDYYWKVFRGVKSPFEQLVTEEKIPEKSVLPTIPATSFTMPSGGETKSMASISIPPLNLEVTPPDTRIVIPRIHQNVPIIGVKNENLIARKWEQLEKDIQGALRSGVVHYPGTALPGEGGNVVLTGHSSYYAWDPGRFKDVFSLLHDVRKGDRIAFYFNQKKYIYEVFDIKVVRPEEVDVLLQTKDDRLTLITCTPIGTNLKRLVVTAKLVKES